MNTPATLAPALDAFITRMPKIELHVHLEGSIQPATLLKIARRNNVKIPARDEAGVRQLFDYRSFHEFLTVFMALARSLLCGEDFELVAYELGHHLADQNVRYAEVMMSVAQYLNRGLDLDELVKGAATGFERARQERGVRVNLAFDYGRQFGLDVGWRALEVAVRNMSNTLIGWSIGGDEVNYPPEQYAVQFTMARRAGLRLMAHAGEVMGPSSVWGAVDVLCVERLGHGIRSIDDPKLVAHLVERGITLDVCPSSNVRTGAVASLAEHPFRKLFDAGVQVTLNTDDPIFFDTTLNNEFRLVARTWNFTADELATLTLNAARGAFLPLNERTTLVHELEQELQLARAECGV